VRKEAAVLKQGEKKLLPDRGVGPAGDTASASQNRRLCWMDRALTVDPPANLFASYKRSLSAAGHALLGRQRQCRQRREEVENAQHFRA
jgi:hypothetical protein